MNKLKNSTISKFKNEMTLELTLSSLSIEEAPETSVADGSMINEVMVDLSFE